MDAARRVGLSVGVNARRFPMRDTAQFTVYLAFKTD